MPKPCQLLLYVPLPFDLKSQALHWDLGKRESEKVKLLPGEQKKVRAFLWEVSVQRGVTSARAVGNLVVRIVLQKQKQLKS